MFAASPSQRLHTSINEYKWHALFENNLRASASSSSSMIMNNDPHPV